MSERRCNILKLNNFEDKYIGIHNIADRKLPYFYPAICFVKIWQAVLVIGGCNYQKN